MIEAVCFVSMVMVVSLNVYIINIARNRIIAVENKLSCVRKQNEQLRKTIIKLQNKDGRIKLMEED